MLQLLGPRDQTLMKAFFPRLTYPPSKKALSALLFLNAAFSLIALPRGRSTLLDICFFLYSLYDSISFLPTYFHGRSFSCYFRFRSSSTGPPLHSFPVKRTHSSLLRPMSFFLHFSSHLRVILSQTLRVPVHVLSVFAPFSPLL